MNNIEQLNIEQLKYNLKNITRKNLESGNFRWQNLQGKKLDIRTKSNNNMKGYIKYRFGVLKTSMEKQNEEIQKVKALKQRLLSEHEHKLKQVLHIQQLTPSQSFLPNIHNLNPNNEIKKKTVTASFSIKDNIPNMRNKMQVARTTNISMNNSPKLNQTQSIFQKPQPINTQHRFTSNLSSNQELNIFTNTGIRKVTVSMPKIKIDRANSAQRSSLDSRQL